jgi:hypothetical protein
MTEVAVYFKTNIREMPACPFFAKEVISKRFLERIGDKIVESKWVLAILPIKMAALDEYDRAKQYLFRFFPDHRIYSHIYKSGFVETVGEHEWNFDGILRNIK